MSGYPTVQVWDDDDHEESPMPAPKPMTPPADAPLTPEARARQIAWSIQYDTNDEHRDALEAAILAALRATEQETWEAAAKVADNGHYAAQIAIDLRARATERGEAKPAPKFCPTCKGGSEPWPLEPHAGIGYLCPNCEKEWYYAEIEAAERGGSEDRR